MPQNSGSGNVGPGRGGVRQQQQGQGRDAFQGLFEQRRGDRIHDDGVQSGLQDHFPRAESGQFLVQRHERRAAA